MSADNGIYILCTPTSRGAYVYRAAHIISCEIDFYLHPKRIHNLGAYLVYQFGLDSPVFHSLKEAKVRAQELSSEILDQGSPLEYGISTINLEYSFFGD